MAVHIVVGSGAAGTMAAVGLLKRGKSVLLIERGPRCWGEGSGLHRDPSLWGTAAYSKTSACSTQYMLFPQQELMSREIVFPQGRGIGGGMNVNAMIWGAGDRHVFDQFWPSEWSSSEMNRLLLEAAAVCELTDISAAGHLADLLVALESQGEAVGSQLSGEEGGPWDPVGPVCRRYPSSTDHKGRRINPIEILERQALRAESGKLFILAETTVVRVLFDGANRTRACGLLVSSSRFCGGAEKVVRLTDNRSEIVLCAGPIESPRILWSSGLGRATRLPRIRLTSPAGMCTADNPSETLLTEMIYHCVTLSSSGNPEIDGAHDYAPNPHVPLDAIGKHLQDHVLLPLFYINISSFILVKRQPSVSEKPTCANVNGVHGWMSVDDQGMVRPQGRNARGRPLKLLFLDGRVAAAMADELLPRIHRDHPTTLTLFLDVLKSLIISLIKIILNCPLSGYLLRECVHVVLVCLVQPKSRGELVLTQTDTVVPDPKYLSSLCDRDSLYAGIFAARRYLRASSKSTAFPVLVEALPGPLFLYGLKGRPFEIYSSLYTTSFFHMAGTCRMTTNANEKGVVDAALRVFGIENLRVADSSVFPVLPTAPTAATAMAVGLKVSELLVDDEDKNS